MYFLFGVELSLKKHICVLIEGEDVSYQTLIIHSIFYRLSYKTDQSYNTMFVRSENAFIFYFKMTEISLIDCDGVSRAKPTESLRGQH